MTQNMPARWCLICGVASTLSEEVWQEIERTDEDVLCPDCAPLPTIWVGVVPK